MSTTASTTSPGFAALNFDCADPATLADFWGQALGRPVSPGAVAGDLAVAATKLADGPRMIFHPVPQPGAITSLLRPILLTEHHDQEIERLTGLGAKVLDQSALPAVRVTTLADPAGNGFDLVTWQSA